MYWKYFKYVVNHKWNVFIECMKAGRVIHAITHDLSKFRPSEFIPYAKFFNDTDRSKKYKITDKNNSDFQKGWFLHQKRNKHHWNYWVIVTRKDEIIPVPMPKKYVIQMICDWKGMSRKFGGNAYDYYNEHNKQMILHKKTKERIDGLFG